VTVSDSGPALSEEVLQEIFVPFAVSGATRQGCACRSAGASRTRMAVS